MLAGTDQLTWGVGCLNPNLVTQYHLEKSEARIDIYILMIIYLEIALIAGSRYVQ